MPYRNLAGHIRGNFFEILRHISRRPSLFYKFIMPLWNKRSNGTDGGWEEHGATHWNVIGTAGAIPTIEDACGSTVTKDA